MNLTPVARILSLTLVTFFVLVARMPAQNLLLTEHKGKYRPVVRAKESRACVMVDGKQVVADGKRFALHKVEEYLPAFISVRNLEVSTRYLNLNGSDMNHEFQLRGRLESPYQLEDVFMLLELNTDQAGKVMFLYEVGTLEPRDLKYISVRVPMTSALGEGRYEMHLFSAGHEVLHSNLDAGYREYVVDEMTRKRVGTEKNSMPQLFIGPQPEYPAKFLKEKKSGQVVMEAKIGANGRVYNPAIKTASDPAFGEAALVAVRLWRFLPQVKDGRPIEAVVNIPIDFTPPEKKAKKS